MVPQWPHYPARSSTSYRRGAHTPAIRRNGSGRASTVRVAGQFDTLTACAKMEGVRRLMHILAEVERIGRLEYEYGNPLAEVLPWNSISKPS
jgi:hypothetical protein